MAKNSLTKSRIEQHNVHGISVFSGFRHSVHKIFALLGCYAA